jgi:hypothetical protein
MELTIHWSQNKLLVSKGERFLKFAQQMANRLIVGSWRYDHGKPIVAARFLTRLKVEVKEYERTGDREHLINAANYCCLEDIAPENEKWHKGNDNKPSVTRDKLRMKI